MFLRCFGVLTLVRGEAGFELSLASLGCNLNDEHELSWGAFQKLEQCPSPDRGA